MRIRAILAILVLVTTGALVGCGDDDDVGGDGGDEAAEGSGDDAAGDAGEGGCAAVGADEVSDIIGQEIVETAQLPTGCQWRLDDTGTSYEWQQVPADVYEANRDTAEAAGFATEEVDDLGEEAFLRLQTSPDGEVLAGETWVLVGEQAFFVRTAGLPGSDDILAAQRTLAEAVAPTVSS